MGDFSRYITINVVQNKTSGTAIQSYPAHFRVATKARKNLTIGTGRMLLRRISDTRESR